MLPQMAVYPRWRGEHHNNLTVARAYPGLSPLARGTLCAVASAIIPSRFIPAGAGNTRNKLILVADIAVYPRWRGEHSRLLLLDV